MSGAEFTEWMIYSKLEPFGEERADLRAGIIAANIANAHRDRKKQPKPFTAFDFMPFRQKPKRSWQDMLAAAKALNQAFGGEDKTKGAS